MSPHVARRISVRVSGEGESHRRKYFQQVDGVSKPIKGESIPAEDELAVECAVFSPPAASAEPAEYSSSSGTSGGPE